MIKHVFIIHLYLYIIYDPNVDPFFLGISLRSAPTALPPERPRSWRNTGRFDLKRRGASRRFGDGGMGGMGGWGMGLVKRL